MSGTGSFGRSGYGTPHEEDPTKFVTDRVNRVERHFGEICQSIAAYVRGLAKVRDRGDQIARSINGYAEAELLNTTTKSALSGFVSGFAGIQDYRNSLISRMESKVNLPLTAYGSHCKKMKENVKVASSAREKAVKEQKNFTRDGNPRNSSYVNKVCICEMSLAINKSSAGNN